MSFIGAGPAVRTALESREPMTHPSSSRETPSHVVSVAPSLFGPDGESIQTGLANDRPMIGHDATIQTSDGTTVRVHRFVVCAFSRFCREQLADKERDTTAKVNAVAGKTLRFLVRAMYTGQVSGEVASDAHGGFQPAADASVADEPCENFWVPSAAELDIATKELQLTDKFARSVGVATETLSFLARERSTGSVVFAHHLFRYPPSVMPGVTMSPGHKVWFADAVIRARDGQRLHCHQCVLAQRCDYFRAQLLGGWLPVR